MLVEFGKGSDLTAVETYFGHYDASAETLSWPQAAGSPEAVPSINLLVPGYGQIHRRIVECEPMGAGWWLCQLEASQADGQRYS